MLVWGILLNGNKFRIATEIQKGEIRKRLPASKHYNVYRESFQGRKDFDIDMRRTTRAGSSSHWEIAIGGKPSHNSDKMRKIINLKRTSPTTKTEVRFIQVAKTGSKSRSI